MSNSSKTGHSRSKKKEELTLSEIFEIINRRKAILFISVITLLAAAFLFNTITKPVYESAVLLKKDKGTQENSKDDDFKDIVLHQSQDEIETEMEIAKTREVLNSVIDTLNLYLTVSKIIQPDGKSTSINASVVDYTHNNAYYVNSGFMPQFVKVRPAPSRSDYSFYIKKADNHTYQIYSSKNDSLLQTSMDSSFFSQGNKPEDTGKFESSLAAAKKPDITFNLPGNTIVMNWPNGPVGSKVYFDIANYYSVIDKLNKNLRLEHVVKTDIFQIAYKSASPYMAQKIANTVAEKFREIRMSQQKQNIRYSFNFVDKQLQDVSEKLKMAEGELSRFKASKQITSIDENSKNLVDFLSNLEAEKIKTNLELTENENKLSQMRSELNTRGYIDQTYLTPRSSEETSSPFSSLLKQLSDLEVQRVELLQKRTEKHPDVVLLDQRIKQIKDKLSSYNQNTLTAYQILINSAKKKEAELTGLTNKYSGRIEALPPEESRLAELIRQKNVYDKIFTLLLDKREEMRIAELSKLQDIIILDEAHEPSDPVYPKKTLNLAVGLLAGIFIGFAGIIIKEVRDRKLITLDEAENELDIPIFAIIP
ncbi:MAG: GumC family protein, partial [Ignavibacteriales bacterium]